MKIIEIILINKFSEDMIHKKKPLLLFTKNGNNYLLSYNKNKLIYLHPIVYRLVLIYFNTGKKVLVYDYLLSNNVKEFEYYMNKFLFLLQFGFLDSKELKIMSINKKKVTESISEVDHVVFEVTEKCNLKCKYCIYGDIYIDKQSVNKDKSLDPRLAKQSIDYIFNRIVKKDIPVFKISFYGGEPLLNFDFIKDIVIYVKTKWPNQKFIFGITTNGVLLDKHIDFFVENNIFILYSLDGSEKHNIYRVFKNGDRSFNKVFSNAMIIKEKNLKYFESNVDFNAVINSESNLDDVCSFFINKFNKKPRLTQSLSYNGLDVSKKDEFVKISNGHSLKNKIISLKQEYEIVLDDYYVFFEETDNLNKSQYFINNKMTTCLPFQTKLFVSSNGEVRNCEKIGSSPNIVKLIKNKIEFDYHAIACKIRLFQNRANKLCESCYKINCNKCILTCFDKKWNFNCDEYIPVDMAMQKFSDDLTCLENSINNEF